MPQFIGFSFPFRKGSTSFPEVATDDALIKQSLVQLILTGRGERVMRPDVGSGAFRFIFEDNDDFLLTVIQTEVNQVVSKYEPRVSLISVDVTKGDPDTDTGANSVIVTLRYIVLATVTAGTLTMSLSSGSP
jgi:hypothetical protein